MVTAKCPSCLKCAGTKSGVSVCACGTTLRIRKNGDVGFQVDAKRPKNAAITIKDGKVKTNGS